MKKSLIGSTGAILVLVPGALLATPERNPFGYWYLSDQPAGWYYDAIVGLEREPVYTGSDRYEEEPELNARAIFRADSGHRYFISIGEGGAIFQLEDDLILATVLEYEEARENDEDPILAEFPEDDDTLEAQISLVKRWSNWTLGGVFQPDILDRGKGLVYFLGVGYDTMLTERLRFSGGLDFSWGDSEHINTEVGIPGDVAARSGLDPYDASGGYKSTTLSLGFGYDYSPRLQFLLQTEVEFYASEMADSPLIEAEGDDVNSEIGLGIRYLF